MFRPKFLPAPFDCSALLLHKPNSGARAVVAGLGGGNAPAHPMGDMGHDQRAGWAIKIPIPAPATVQRPSCMSMSCSETTASSSCGLLLPPLPLPPLSLHFQPGWALWLDDSATPARLACWAAVCHAGSRAQLQSPQLGLHHECAHTNSLQVAHVQPLMHCDQTTGWRKLDRRLYGWHATRHTGVRNCLVQLWSDQVSQRSVGHHTVR